MGFDGLALKCSSINSYTIEVRDGFPVAVNPNDTTIYKYDFSILIDGIKNPDFSSTVSGFSDYFYGPEELLEEEVTSS
jgi:hypothetical protein